MDRADMALLIAVEDTIHSMDKALVQLAGHGHASGKFTELDNVFDVIQNNSHECFSDITDDNMERFFSVLRNTDLTPEERADILINGVICI